jgi:hypothetical protein
MYTGRTCECARAVQYAQGCCAETSGAGRRPRDGVVTFGCYTSGTSPVWGANDRLVVKAQLVISVHASVLKMPH